jgi:putative tryptophan/tyrosine transport system substrate-binding protein
MRRRDFIKVVAWPAIPWPLAARAQQSGKLPTIGFVGAGTPSSFGPWVTAFVQRLRELGWIENRTVPIEIRWAEGGAARYGEIAAEFVRLKVDAILTTGTPATLAAKQATSVIPIVFVGVNDPVALGVVASLARPVANLTGLSNQQHDVAGKRLELLREVVPGLHRLAILGNPANTGFTLEMKDVQTLADTIGLETVLLEIREAEEIGPALESLNNRADALYFSSDPLFNSNRIRINTVVPFAVANRLCLSCISKREV